MKPMSHAYCRPAGHQLAPLLTTGRTLDNSPTRQRHPLWDWMHLDLPAQNPHEVGGLHAEQTRRDALSIVIEPVRRRKHCTPME